MVKLKRRNRIALISVLGGGLLASLLIASAFGAVNIPIPDIIKMAIYKLTSLDITSSWRAADETILFHIRLPRVIGGAAVGAALATAGVLFQGLLRNPLADPYIIGTSAGAALGAVIAMLIPVNIAILNFGLVPLAAFIGAILTVILVYNLARIGGRTPIISMLLAGFAVTAFLMAIMSFFMSMSERFNLNLQAVYSFLMGHISVTGWEQLAVVVPLVIGGIVASRFFAFHLNAFSIGEEGAASLGIEVEKDKLVILVLGSLLTAVAVSISGLVSFVGLVVPHTMRLILGPDHRLLIPASALAGGILVVIADLLARTLLAPVEIPVGIITAIIGAPFFIHLLRRTRREYAF